MEATRHADFGQLIEFFVASLSDEGSTSGQSSRVVTAPRASNLEAMASDLEAMASNLEAMGSNLEAMGSNLLAMASNLLGKGTRWNRGSFQIW